MTAFGRSVPRDTVYWMRFAPWLRGQLDVLTRRCKRQIVWVSSDEIDKQLLADFVEKVGFFRMP